jgi:ribosomal-protein-alanine N-acetyltransferase
MTAALVTRLESAAELDEVLSVDAESFLRPWTRAMYEAELGNPAVTRIFLIRVDDQVIGYCASWFLPGELHINNLAIRPAYRRRGLASVLLVQVLEAAGSAGCVRATLEVRRSNHAARKLYEGLGFRLAGVRHDYYVEPVEDALILWRDAVETANREPSPGQNG